MYHSNQILKITGDLYNSDTLATDLDFCLQKSDYRCFNPEGLLRPTFQYAKSGAFCIGWSEKEGWEPFQFNYDKDIIARIVKQYLLKNCVYEDITYGDGSTSKGYMIRNIDGHISGTKDSLATIYEIKNPFYGCIIITPYTCYYAK